MSNSSDFQMYDIDEIDILKLENDKNFAQIMYHYENNFGNIVKKYREFEYIINGIECPMTSMIIYQLPNIIYGQVHRKGNNKWYNFTYTNQSGVKILVN